MAALLSPDSDWQADGKAHEMRLGAGAVAVRIEDESAKIDLNRADEATLASMLVSTGMPPGEARQLAAAIADYRDPDNIQRPGGAEAIDY
jgi:general secretion pathway protein K